MSQIHTNKGTVICTIGGTLFSVFGGVQTNDIVRTVVLAIIGTATSFVVSLLLKLARGRMVKDG